MTNRESRFTVPSKECRHPEYWTSHDSDSTENEVIEMLGGMVRGLQPDYVVETGSAFGYGTAAIGQALQSNGHGHLDSIEVVPERVRIAQQRTAHLDRVTVHEMSSLDFVPTAPIDFVFFDSLFPLRAKEFRAYYPYMHHGTVVAFHDTGPQHPLRPDIDKLAAEGWIDVIYLPTPRGIAIGRINR